MWTRSRGSQGHGDMTPVHTKTNANFRIPDPTRRKGLEKVSQTKRYQVSARMITGTKEATGHLANGWTDHCHR